LFQVRQALVLIYTLTPSSAELAPPSWHRLPAESQPFQRDQSLFEEGNHK